MLIKFKGDDPRAGTVVCMDSSRGQYFIDSGAADAVKEGAEAPPAASSPAPATAKPAGGAELTPGQKLVAATAADVITAVEVIVDPALLQAGLEAEQAGKKRKTVLDAFAAKIDAVKD